MLLRNVVGQQAAKEGLLQMNRSNRLPHALMLAGREGTGGLPLALAFAQYIFCGNKGDVDACGQCPNCQKVTRLEHADLHLSFPVISPRVFATDYIREFREFVKQSPYGTTYDWLQFIDAENKQGNITAKESRRIIDALNLKSYEGGMKVLIMWRPEYLGKEGNILLKLIEEPPANTLMLFVAENPDEVLLTIRSRTQMVRLAPIPIPDIAAALSGRLKMDAQRATQVAQLAQGSFTEALQLAKHADNDLLPAMRNWFNAIFTNKGGEIIKFVDEWAKAGREQQKNLLQYVIETLEHSLRATYIPEVINSLPPQEGDFIKKLAARRFTPQAIQQMVQALTEAAARIERNAYSKAQLLAVSLRIQQAVK